MILSGSAAKDDPEHEHEYNRDHVPRWWLWTRRVVSFGLGVWVIVDSLIEKQVASVGKLIIGLVMIGVLPLDDLIRVVRRARRER